MYGLLYTYSFNCLYYNKINFNHILFQKSACGKPEHGSDGDSNGVGNQTIIKTVLNCLKPINALHSANYIYIHTFIHSYGFYSISQSDILAAKI